MPLTILSDADVRQVLDGLTADDVIGLQNSLRKALHEYSTGTQGEGACAMHQPERTSMQTPGATTLFMPSRSSSGIGMKVVTLGSVNAGDSGTPSKSDATPHGALTIMSANGEPTGFLNAEEITAFRTALASSILFCRRKSFKNIVVFGAGRQAFWHIRLALVLRGHTIKSVNIINRTFSERAKALLRELYSVDQATKEREGWANVKFSVMTPTYGEYPRLLQEQLRAADVIVTTVPSTAPLFDHNILTSTEGRRRGRLIVAIGSYKPHMIEIPIELLHQAVKSQHEHRHFHKHAMEGGVVIVDTLTGCLKEAGEVIQAGLSPHQLVEVGELVMLQGQFANPANIEDLDEVMDAENSIDLETLQIDPPSGDSSLPSMGREGSDESALSMESADRKSMDSAKPGRRESFSKRASFTSGKIGHKIRSLSVDSQKAKGRDDAMSSWLSKGNVVYKCVGMGLMDLVIGGDLVALARERGVGTNIDRF